MADPSRPSDAELRQAAQFYRQMCSDVLDAYLSGRSAIEVVETFKLSRDEFAMLLAGFSERQRRGFFGYKEPQLAHTNVQWKNTDLCMDFYCECGAQSHFDGDMAMEVKCPKCETVWEMPTRLYPRLTERPRSKPQMLEHDDGDFWKGDQG